MKGLLVVAGLAAAAAVVSGLLLLAAPPGGGAGRSASPAGGSVRDGAATRRIAEAPPEFPAEVEKRLRALEVRLEEIQGQLLLLGGAGGGWVPGAGESRPEEGAEGAGTEADAGPPGDGGTSADYGSEGDPGASGDSTDPAVAKARELRRKAADLRRELEIQRRLEQMTISMELQPVERERLDRILRDHVAGVDELGARAKTLFRDSPFGVTPADRATLEQMEKDRRGVDQATERSILELVGAERWKVFRKSVKEQGEKERTLRRMGQPW